MARLTSPQLRKLGKVPDEWEVMPIMGDFRSFRPLVRKRMIEIRDIDVTPPDWNPVIKVVRREYRRTDAGRLALA